MAEVRAAGSLSTALKTTSPFYTGISPDWKKLPHKGMPRPKSEEYETIVDDYGRALAGAETEEEYEKLEQQVDLAGLVYASAVSPDRRALADEVFDYFEESVAESSSRPGRERKRLNLFDYMNLRDGIAKLVRDEGGRVTLDSGTTIEVTNPRSSDPGLEIKRSPSGEGLFGFSGRGWYVNLTSQEQAMNREFHARIVAAVQRHRSETAASSDRPRIDRLV